MDRKSQIEHCHGFVQLIQCVAGSSPGAGQGPGPSSCPGPSDGGRLRPGRRLPAGRAAAHATHAAPAAAVQRHRARHAVQLPGTGIIL